VKDLQYDDPDALWLEAYAGMPDIESLELTSELQGFLDLLMRWHIEAPRSDPQTVWDMQCGALPTSKEVLSILRLFPSGDGLAGQRVATYCSAPAHDRELLCEHQRGIRRVCGALSVDAPHHLHDTYSRGHQARPGWSYLWQLAETRQIDVLVMLTLNHVPGPDREWIVVSRLLEEFEVRLYVVDESAGCLTLVPSPETVLQWLACEGSE
jgi:hypothetical protein